MPTCSLIIRKMHLSSTSAYGEKRTRVEWRSSPQGVRSCGRRALHVSAAGQWSIGSIIGAIQGAYEDKVPVQGSPSAVVSGPQPELPTLASLPATFQRLDSQLVVLLDPKHERLVYLVGVDQASGTDAIVSQLRPLLRAASAPYLHLMALSARLRSALLREFPGGRPIITQVPLPAGAAASQGQEAGPAAAEEAATAAAAGEGGSSGQEGGEYREYEFPRGGVLEWLYGSREQQQQQKERRREQQQRKRAVGGGLSSYDAGEEEEEEGGAAAAPDSDTPDEVMSRRRKLPTHMAWLKGSSQRVALSRERRAPYRLEWLLGQLGSFGPLSIAVATDDIIFVRNAVLANWATDFDPSDYYGELFQHLLELGEEGEEGEGGAGEEEQRGPLGVVGGPAGAVLAAVQVDEGEPRDLRGLLQAIGVIGADSDSEEEDEDDEEEANVAEEEHGEGEGGGEGGGVTVLADGDDEEEDASDADEEEEGEGEEGGLPPVLRILRGPLLPSLQHQPAAPPQPAMQLLPTSSGSGGGASGPDPAAEDGEVEGEVEVEGEARVPPPAASLELLLAGAAGGGEEEAAGGGDDDDDDDEEEEAEAVDSDDDDDEDEDELFNSLFGPVPGWPDANEDDDASFNLDAQLSGGPLGWTLSLRVRPDRGGGAAGGGAGGGR
ncbi:hypothetical protein Agub_g10345, partial [Astrephomene gubernaculifera]